MRPGELEYEVALEAYLDRLRDEFAMAALTGLIAGHEASAGEDVLEGYKGGFRVSKAAYMYADAMMKAREVKP
jgi:hypothetical protein